jgi:outer membrane protein assembly factor BamB
MLWKLDFVNQLGVFKRDATVNPLPSPLLEGDRVYCVTGNGSIHGDEHKTETRSFVPNPDAPSFVAIDANTGKLLWKNSAPGKSICYGQWGSPAKLVVGDTVAILFPGGDGFLYALAPDSGRVLAKVNLNQPGTKPWGYQQRGDVAFCSQRPLVVGQMIYLGLAQDQDMPIGKRFPIMCVDGEELLKGSSRDRVIKWEHRNDEFDGTLGEMAVSDNRLYAISRTGCLLCIDRKWGHLNWLVSHEGSTRFPGIAIHGGRVYVPTDDSIWVYDDASVPRALLRYRFEYMPMGKPVIADNDLFFTTSSYLWCLQLKK